VQKASIREWFGDGIVRASIGLESPADLDLPLVERGNQPVDLQVPQGQEGAVIDSIPA